MKFYNWINEKDYGLENDEQFIKSVQKNAKNYIRLLNKNGIMPFYRNMGKESVDGNYGIKKVRKNRRSRGTNKRSFEKLNKWLAENGHNRRDQSVIGTSKYKDLNIFGEPYFIFPIGDFSYTYVKALDFNDPPSTRNLSNDEVNIYDDFLTGNPAIITSEVDAILKKLIVTDKNIKEAERHYYEIWFNCDKYYYIYVGSKKDIEYWEKGTDVVSKIMGIL